jgi:CheY-like chemotaxis protein
VTIEVGDMPMAHLKQHMERTFRQLATDKGLDFKVKFDARLPSAIRTDEKRLQQIVLNLLSNAFKFTSKGGVTLAVTCADKGWSQSHPVLARANRAIEISVTDTGIGIPEDKQKLIFEAFQQADGTTSRKYGGTGLGLSISREIARLLGGELQVRSVPGEGSTFTLYVPLVAEAAAETGIEGGSARYENSGAIVPTALPTGFEVNDDRDELGKDPFVLIVEDDPTFASILLDAAHEAGLKGVVSTAGAGTLAMARKLQPSAISLDLGLSDIDGFVLLDLLKHDPETSSLPIHVISGAKRSKSAMAMGAFGVTEKPAERADLVRLFTDLREEAGRKPRRRKRKSDGESSPAAMHLPELAGAKVLIVDDDIRNIFSLTSVLESHDVEVLHAERGKDGILILEQTPDVDVALIDIMMPDMDGYETMRQIRQRPELAEVPLISVTAKAMKGDRQKCLDAGASDYIAKPVDIELLLALVRVWVARGREAAVAAALEAAE